MKKIIYSGVIVLFFAVSCKKSDSGNNNNNIVVDPYMTTTVGIIWNYKTHDNRTGLDTTTVTTSTSKDTTMFGKQYHIYTDMNIETAQTDTSYMSNVGSDYFQLASLSAQIDPFEMKYLSTTANVGENWSNTLSSTSAGTTINATIRNTIEEKGGSLTLGTKTYTNVIKVKTEITSATITLNIPPFGNQTITPTIIQDVHSYFAPKYGLIKRDYKLNISASFFGQTSSLTNVDKSTTLTSSTIQ